jgi:hypothetical protein
MINCSFRFTTDFIMVCTCNVMNWGYPPTLYLGTI